MMELERFVYQDVVASHGEKIAKRSAAALFDCLWFNFRKQTLYVPTVDRTAMERRNGSIFREFNGANHADLSVNYRLSLQQIYSIIRMQRAKYSAKTAQAEKPISGSHDKPLTLLVIEEYLPADLVKCGLSGEEAVTLAQKIAAYLFQRFPGVMIRITDALKASRAAKAMPTEYLESINPV